MDEELCDGCDEFKDECVCGDLPNDEERAKLKRLWAEHSHAIPAWVETPYGLN